jgi:hypothetical protein
MGYEDAGDIEKLKGGKPSSSAPKMTLQKAIELGEYDPKFLATFPEWNTFSRHVQFQHIRNALDNRENQLRVQWAEVVNFLDFSKKPHLKKTLDNIQKQIKLLDKDREELYLEYSS